MANLSDGYRHQQRFIKEALNPLTQEIRNVLMQLANEDLESMKAWPAETIAKAKAAETRLAKPDMRKEMTEGFKKNFEDADADKDSYLSKAEYIDFCAKMRDLYNEKDLPIIPQTEEYEKRMWEVLNKIRDENEGVASGDISLSKNFMNGYMVQQRRMMATPSEAK